MLSTVHQMCRFIIFWVCLFIEFTVGNSNIPCDTSETAAVVQIDRCTILWSLAKFQLYYPWYIKCADIQYQP